MAEKTNKEIWDKVKSPPKDALREIRGGRISGMTDISPQWRLQIMTEIFGPVGIGWNFKITKQWLDVVDSNALSDIKDICAFTNIELKYKLNEEWSEWIPGTGGSKFAATESRGLHVSDECFKMSLTDALSVAMKSIGVGAEVYLGKMSHNGKSNGDTSSKYSAPYASGKSDLILCPVSTCKNKLTDYGTGDMAKKVGARFYCKKNDGGCGAKFKTEDDLKNHDKKLIDSLRVSLLSRIVEARKKFIQAGLELHFIKIIGDAGYENEDEIQTAKEAEEILSKLTKTYEEKKPRNETAAPKQ